MWYNFEKVSLRGYKSVKCSVCGKRLNRQRKFWQTINPYNLNDKGEIKSANEIQAELVIKIDKWKQLPEHCQKCSIAIPIQKQQEKEND